MATATAAPQNRTTAPPRTSSKFFPNFEPKEVALKSIEGQPTHSRYDGDQICFELTDGRKWYTDIVVGQKIKQMLIQPGEVFCVYKSEVRRGNRRIIELEIEPVVGKEPAGIAPKGTQPAGNQGTSGTVNSNPSTARQPAPASATAAIAATAANVPMNGNGETIAVQLARCYREAVEIAAVTVGYAAKHGLVIAPAFCDVRALAATIAISEQQGRRS